MEHAGVDLLLLNVLGLFKILHCLNELFDPIVDFVVFCREHSLEVLVRSGVYLLGVLSRLLLLREQLSYFVI